MTMVDIEELMTVRRAALALGFTPTWLGTLINRGKIKAVEIDGVRFVARSEVERYKQESQTPVAA